MTKNESERLSVLETITDKQNDVLLNMSEEMKKQTEILIDVKVFTEKLSTTDKRVTALESNQARVAWIIVSTVLMALLAIVVKGDV